MNCNKCGKCCVNVPMTLEEYERLVNLHPIISRAAIHYGFAVEIHGLCPLYSKEKGCIAYEHRARVCRMFPVVVTGHNGTSTNMAPSSFCPQTRTVSAEEIQAARAMNAEFNDEMARHWKQYKQEHPDANQMAINFLSSRNPSQDQPIEMNAGENLSNFVDTYTARLSERKIKESAENEK